ncbi:hypothetical protein PR048_012551 [Dryococelus australis]|uniref:HTH psq-type domain-containing protein n=1 Tax=Dryococelus australis TaxID=614101 RepID=A0ABQ9HPZ2_9NEOP|nr:hypothetical protein PR048_012551 [Dryococelus australis]
MAERNNPIQDLTVKRGVGLLRQSRLAYACFMIVPMLSQINMAPVQSKLWRCQWTSEKMNSAISAVRSGRSVKFVASEFGIPRRTLRNHVISGRTNRKLGRSPVLTIEQEIKLSRRLFRLADVDMLITKNNIIKPFNPLKCKAGHRWLELFMKRHPDVAKCRTQHLNPGRSSKLNRYIVKYYFAKLRDVMLESDVVINLIRYTMLTKKFVPPMILLRGKRLKPEWEENLPPGANTVMTPKGSMTCETFSQWIDHFAKYKASGDRTLIIFGGTSLHLYANIVSAADRYNITLFSLPSNSTHELQPLEKSVFKSFESFWGDEVLKFWMTRPDLKINRSTF